MLDKTIAPPIEGMSSIERSRALTTILYGGLSAGVLDITAAFIISSLRHGRGPVLVLQSIAGGLLGRNAAFQGGLKTAALGLALHFLIATTATAVYYAVSLKLPLIVRRAVGCGLLYGIAVYLFMQMVVLPLSALHVSLFNQPATAILIGVLVHMVCVGLPIALVVRWGAK